MKYDNYNVFISSPSDVEKERKIATDTLNRINTKCSEVLHTLLIIKKWEDLSPRIPERPEEKIQDILNEEVAKCHFFVLILNKRYGTIEKGYTKSNTEREIDIILEHHQKNQKKKVLAYLRKLEPNKDPGPEEQKIIKLRERLCELDILYKEYDNHRDFQIQFTHDMYDTIMRLKLSPYKVSALRKFWKFGDATSRGRHSIAIVYPPVPREFMGGEKDTTAIWHKRIQPNIFFEDYKAIHKIQKTLSLAGFNAFRVYPCSGSLPDDLHLMNRIWICAPRNPKAFQYLDKYKSRTRFKFQPRTNKSAKLKWKTDSGNWITITSPLPQYLHLQRDLSDAKHEWKHSLGQIVARDYAILARFDDCESTHQTEHGEPLRDYFFAGIRGLGTWGASFLVDRRSQFLMSLPETGDIQLLLEVHYADDRLIDVIDVSANPEVYFKENTSAKYIKKIIYNHKE